MSRNLSTVLTFCHLALSEEFGIRVFTSDPQLFKQTFYNLRHKDKASPAHALTIRNCPNDPQAAIMLVKQDLENLPSLGEVLNESPTE